MLKGKGKSNSSRNSTQDPEATARESSHRPRGRVGQFLKKVKGGVNKLRISRSKDSTSRSPVPPNINDERISSTLVQTTPSVVEADTQSALQDTQEAVQHMHSLSGPAYNRGLLLPKTHKRISMPLTISRTHISSPLGYSILLSESSRMYIHMRRWHWACCLVQRKYVFIFSLPISHPSAIIIICVDYSNSSESRCSGTHSSQKVV
ncbi:hypothetical protein DFJ58DRAFT_27102 [Suillus subalutaceus]|uniref:uncharacterized protein n=1 Tax=Suillus subalutaceus TaxID=48586 RepID=UPI001B87B6AE|nr:uncharacterized protein DFJ58DRAFT_27102 [Suillus subalutaceus]KAG1844513.1 hypothetical protein DFJ58DRAFT_27102 [Suillus subalutaceus]